LRAVTVARIERSEIRGSAQAFADVSVEARAFPDFAALNPG
jgi:hypothetical protein